MSYSDKIDWRTSGYGPEKGVALGTPGTGVVAEHFTVDGHHIVTKLTVNGVLPAVTGTIGVGLLAYTFPAGVHALKSGRIALALTQSGGLVNADTPDLGLGDTIAVGAVATLTTAAWENILTGQTMNNCTGTVEDKALVQVTAAHLMNEAAGTKTVYINVADIWAGADAGIAVTGEIWLEWTRLNGVSG